MEELGSVSNRNISQKSKYNKQDLENSIAI